MPVTLVQEADAASSTVTLGANATAGNCLVVAVACLGATSATGVTGVTLGANPDNFTLVTPGPSARDSTSPNDYINVSVWADPNCAGGSTAVAVTGTGVVAAWAWEFSGLSGTPDIATVLPVNGYHDSWIASAAQTTVPAEAWLAVTCAANQTATETLTVNNVTGWMLQNAYSGTSGSYDWGAVAAYQTVNTVGTPTLSGAFSQQSFSVTVLVTFGAALPAAPAAPAVAGTLIAAGISASGGGLTVQGGVSASAVNAGSPATQTTTAVQMIPVGPKTGNYTAKPGDFVLVNPSGTNAITITFPAAAPTGSIVGVKLIKSPPAAGSVTVAASGADVFDTLPAGTSQMLMFATGATFIAQYKASAGTWYIQSASYTEPSGVLQGAPSLIPGTPVPGSPAPGDAGLISWSYDPAALTTPFTGTALTAGKIYLIMCPVRATVNMTGGFLTWITSGGSGLTAGQNFAGVYSAAGAKLLDSGDVTAAFGSSGEFVNTYTGFTASPPYVWAALLSNGTTPPSFARTGNQTGAWANLVLPTSAPRFGVLSGTYTSLPSSFGGATPGYGTAMYWAGLY